MEPDLLDSPAAGPAAVRGGMVRVVGYATGVIITVGSAAVLFRHLGVGDAGRYVLVLSIVNLAAGLTDAGLSSIGVRELSLLQDGGGRSRMLANLLGLRVAFTLVGILGACAYTLLAGMSGELVGATAIAGGGLLLQNLQSTYATPLMADLLFVRVALLDLLKQAATAVGIIALAIAGAGLVPFFAVAPVAGLITLVVTLVVVRGTTPLLPRIDRARWRALLAQTLPFALAVAVGAIYFRLAILLVDALSTEAETGLFGASFRIVEVLIILPQLAVGAALPVFARAARDDGDRLRYGLGLVTEAMVITGAALALALAAGAPVAIEIVAGDDFEAAAGVLRLHAVALLFSFVAAPFAYALISLRRHRDIVVANLAAVAVLVVALALLVPDHGAEGGAVATIIGEATLAGAYVTLAARGGFRVQAGRLPRIVLAAALAVAPAALLPALPAAVAAVAVFGAALLALRAVPPEALGALRR